MAQSEKSTRLAREDWICAAIRELHEHGIDGIKIIVLAKKLGATSGSFYWHFKDQPELLSDLLDYWESELTDKIIEQSRTYRGLPADRISELMLNVIENDAASLDHAISVWARRDRNVREAFERTIQKRLDHAAWMFQTAGFGSRQASVRGRLMVAYLMGESATLLKTNSKWRHVVREVFEVLVGSQCQPG